MLGSVCWSVGVGQWTGTCVDTWVLGSVDGLVRGVSMDNWLNGSMKGYLFLGLLSIFDDGHTNSFYDGQAINPYTAT